MRRDARLSLLVLVVLATAVVARADLGVGGLHPATEYAASLTDRVAPPCEQTTAQTCGTGTLAGQGVEDFASGALSFGHLPLSADSWGQLGSHLAGQDSGPVVEELPGLPGSANLFLSAVVSLGAWQVVRRSRDINLSHLPEWYHPDAPLQIGHSVAVDLQFAPLAVCSFEETGAGRPVFFSYIRRELPSRCESRYFLTVEAPRGPPILSS